MELNYFGLHDVVNYELNLDVFLLAMGNGNI